MAKLKTANPYDEHFFAEDRPAVSPSLQGEVKPAPILSTSATANGPSVRLNIEIDKGLHRQLKRLALDQDRTIAEIVRTLISSFVADPEG